MDKINTIINEELDKYLMQNDTEEPDYQNEVDRTIPNMILDLEGMIKSLDNIDAEPEVIDRIKFYLNKAKKIIDIELN